MSNFNSQQEFLRKLLQAVAESLKKKEESRPVVYALLQANLNLLDDNFAQLLRSWATKKLCDLEVGSETVSFLIAFLDQISRLIQQFPRGNQDRNIEIAIAGFETLLSFGPKAHPKAPQKLWTMIQNDLEYAYYSRLWLKISNIFDLNGDSLEQVAYPILQANLRLLNDGFAQWLKNLVTEKLSSFKREEKPGDAEMFAIFLAETITKFSVLIQNFPQGNKANNIEIAIAGYESLLQVYTKEKFPELWAKTQVEIGRAYSQRLKGDKADNLERGILCYHKALQVFNPESFKDEWAITLNNLGAAYVSLTEIPGSNKKENMAKALSYFQQLFPDNMPSSEHERMAMQNFMYVLMSDSLDFKIQKANEKLQDYNLQNNHLHKLDEAIALFEEILTHSEFETHELRWVVLKATAYAFLQSYDAKRDLKDLERALSICQKLEKEIPSDSDDFAGVLVILGEVFRSYYRHTGKKEYLDKAVKAYQSVKLRNFDGTVAGNFYFNFALTLRTRYHCDGNLADLKSAIDAYQKSIEIIRKNPSDIFLLQRRLNNFGNVLRDYHSHTNDLTVLERAIATFKEAVDLARKHFPHELAMNLTNLGTVFRHRYGVHTHNPEDIQKAISAFKEAVNLTPPDSHDLALHVYLNNLGMGYLTRFRITKENRTDLEEAITAFRQAIKLVSIDSYSSDPAKYHINLGQAFLEQDNLEEAITAFKTACQKGSKVATGEVLRGASEWMRSAFIVQNWTEVKQAYSFAYKAGEQLFQTQLIRQDKELQLKNMQGLSAQGAYALAKMNKLTEAVVTLERGLARLLSEALVRERSDLEQLKVKGHNDLYHRYQQAVNDWHNTQHAKDESVYDRLRAVREELDKTIAAIRQVNGYAGFLMAPNFKDIVAAVKDSTLVYLLATKAGGLALIVKKKKFFFGRQTAIITPVWLPELTEEALQQILVSELPDSGYLRAYYDWITHPKEDTYRQEWFNSLEKTTQLLWKQIMAPLIHALPKQAQVTLIPVGLLGLLPLHAAWTEDSNMPTGKRYALDELTISYAPNARSLTEARKIAHRVKADRMLAVNEPKPVKASSLPSSEYEVQIVSANFAQPQIFKHEAATRQAILDALPACNVLHCSCHGIADLYKPLESALMMANYELLTVKDFLDLRLNGVRLATLSACETGIPGMELPDEVVGLPAGLLQAGVAGVVASLWSVNDISTALLMTKFYQNVTKLRQQQGTHASIAPALQAAQCWLRDATKEELEQWSLELPLNATQKRELRRRFKKMKPQTKPYQESYYWAAFCAIGV